MPITFPPLSQGVGIGNGSNGLAVRFRLELGLGFLKVSLNQIRNGFGLGLEIPKPVYA